MDLAEKDAQAVILDLIRSCGSWNNFNGEQVATELESRRGIWIASYLTALAMPQGPDGSTGSLHNRINLLPLRQLARGHFAPDTLLIMPAAGYHADVEQLAKGWAADELSWWDFDFVAKAMRASKHDKELFPDEDRAVLYVWWD